MMGKALSGKLSCMQTGLVLQVGTTVLISFLVSYSTKHFKRDYSWRKGFALGSKFFPLRVEPFKKVEKIAEFLLEYVLI